MIFKRQSGYYFKITRSLTKPFFQKESRHSYKKYMICFQSGFVAPCIASGMVCQLKEEIFNSTDITSCKRLNRCIFGKNICLNVCLSPHLKSLQPCIASSEICTLLGF